MKTCPRCKNQNCFRPLKQSEFLSQRDTLARDGGTHLLCVKCDYLIPKDQIITSFFSLSVKQTFLQTVHSLSGNNSFNKSTGPIVSKTKVMFSLGAGPVGFSLRCSQ
jgi:hypothetical protein